MSSIGAWWKNIPGTTKFILILSIVVVGVVGVQAYIIQLNKSKIESLQTQIDRGQYDQKIKDLETKANATLQLISSNAARIEDSDKKIKKLSSQIAGWAAQPDQTADKVVEGFKAIRNDPK